MDIPVSCCFTFSRWFVWIIPFIWNQRIVSGSWMLAQPHCNLLKFFRSGNIWVVHNLFHSHPHQCFTKHSVGVSSGLTQSTTSFHTSSLLLYGSHTIICQNQNHIIMQMVIILQNVTWAVWMNCYIQIMVVTISHSTYPHAHDRQQWFQNFSVNDLKDSSCLENNNHYSSAVCTITYFILYNVETCC